jgi:predicted glycosyltransferase
VPACWLPGDGADFIKLPSVLQTGRWFDPAPFVSSGLALPFEELRALRADVLLGALRRFRPDLLYVDFLPAGVMGELAPSLRLLKQEGHARLVLGLRDIVNEGKQARRAWTRDGAYDLLDEVYDRVVVLGQPDVWDLVREVGLSSHAAARTRYVGYLRREPGARSAERVRAELGLHTGRLVLVTVGGGADGEPVLRAMLEALRRSPGATDFDCLLVSGPFMPAARREALQDLAAGLPLARVVEFVEDLPDYVAAADVVVSMAGYNTVCEILSFARPAVLVPRAEPSLEQTLRARALGQRGLVRMLHPADLTPAALLREVLDLLDDPSRLQPPAALNLEGLPNLLAELEALLTRPAAG